MKKVLITLLISFLFFACEEPMEPPHIDQELAAIIQTFVDEGAQRGVNVSIDNLEAFLVDEISIEEECGEFCANGWSSYSWQGNPRIEILNTGPCWTNRTEIEKENLVFHQLGHALLERDHRNYFLPNYTSPRSIMCAGRDCNSFQIFFKEGPLRDFYLDELFDIKTPFPSSFLNKQFERVIIQEDFSTFDNWEVINLYDKGTIKQYDVSANTGSLLISNPQTIWDSAQVLVSKRFELNGQRECANLVARANIRTEGLVHGGFALGINLMEKNSRAEWYSFFFDEKKESVFVKQNNTYDNFELEIYCIPRYTDAVTISFRVKSRMSASVIIDDLVLELWE